MALIIFQLKTAAQAARTAIMTTAAVASHSSADLGHTAIEQASRQNKWLFAAYMVFVVGAAVLTFLLWRSGNTVQNAIVADANARIEEAKSSAASATKNAGEANERSKNLERENLILSGHVATLQIELSKQQEKTANAEKALLELKERLAHRTIGPKVHEVAVKELLPFAGARVGIGTVGSGDKEVESLRDAIANIFKDAKWAVSLSAPTGLGEPQPFTVICYVNPQTAAGLKVAQVCAAFPGAGVVRLHDTSEYVAFMQIRPKQTP